MRTTNVSVPNPDGEKLNVLIDLPDSAAPTTYAIFAHCFTCNADLRVVRHISRALVDAGLGVVRFDFTGLGHSEGDFADTNFSSNTDDLIEVAAYLEQNRQAPQLLVGHSLGGAAVLNVAGRLPSVRAVATINAPAEPAHVRHLMSDIEAEVVSKGEAEVKIAGRPFTIKKQFIEDLENADLAKQLASLNRALLVLHAPRDETVGVENAAQIFAAAKHPKSYVSLDDADHLLSNPEDAKYAGNLIANWFSKYQTPSESHGDAVVVRTGAGYTSEVWASGHRVLVDEPASVGGADLGPNPYDYLLAGLGSCTSITIRMYADRKKIPLESVTVALRHDRVHSRDCNECESESGQVDVITRTISLDGDLTDEQRASLRSIADKCPVHRTMSTETLIKTELLD